MAQVPLAIEEHELIQLLREGLDGGADRVHFRAGCSPLGTGHGEAQPLGSRQLAVDDVLSIVEILLRRCYVPESASDSTCDAATELGMLCELHDEALLVPHVGRDDRGLFIVVELARPLTEPPLAIEFA